VVTQFTTKLSLSQASDFVADEYLASIAQATGASAGNVRIKSINFVIAVKYSFADDVSESEVIAGAAAIAGVSESAVTATLTTVRRLSDGGQAPAGRRLAVEAAVEISTTDQSAADGIATAAADPAALAASISTATGRTIAAPTVTEAPALSVVVVTEVISDSATPVAAPSAAEITAAIKSVTGKDMVAEVTNVILPTTTTTTELSDDESSAANKKAVLSSVLGLLVAGVFSRFFC
jgi:hypothetical protein